MRELADAARIQSFMRALGREARTPGHVYFTGGATAVLLGWRLTTIDVDVKIVPDEDVRAMLDRGLVDADGLRAYFAAIQPQLYRYPAIDPAAFARAVDSALHGSR